MQNMHHYVPLHCRLHHSLPSTPLYLYTADEQFFLQFDFMNCYLRMMGMNSVVCEERTRQACSALLNRPEHKLQDNIFEKFYNDLPALCYHAAVRILTLFALYVIRLIGKCCPPGHRVGPETSLQGVDATYVNKMDWRDLMYSLTMQ